MLLYGKNSVLERLKADPGTIKKVLIQDSADLPQIVKLARANKILVEAVAERHLHRLKPVKTLQGVVAKADPFQYASFDDLLTRAEKDDISLVFLDRINDPQNFGSIVRSAACFGRFAVVIPRHKACEVTETVLHVASGGENYVPIACVPNLSMAIMQAQECGCVIVGADIGEGTVPLEEAQFIFPLGLVLGFEGSGIRYGVRKHLDLRVTISMGGSPLSLNVAVAAAIFCHEIARRRKGS